MIRADFPDVTLIENTTNLGFTRANNQAIVRSSGRYILLLNPDTEVTAEALATLVSYLDANAQVGAVGPQLIFANGSVQSSRRRFPEFATLFLESTVLQRLFARSRLLQRYYMLDRAHDVEQDVDWLVGACLMARREAVEGAGVLDEQFFMYSEEMDWCLRIKQQGWRIVYVPAARVIHHEARSSEQAAAAQHIYFHSSRVAYARKHFGTLRGELLRVFLLLSYVYQILEEGSKWLLGHKRALRAQRIALYQAVLATGLEVSGLRSLDAPVPDK